MATKDLNPEADPVCFTVAEAAAFLRLHPKTIERACRRGELPATRVGRAWRISREELLRMLLGAFGRSSPALRPELQIETAKGQPRQRRAYLRAPRTAPTRTLAQR